MSARAAAQAALLGGAAGLLGAPRALGAFWRAVLGDYRQVARYRAKYHQQALPTWRLPLDFVQKIGFQLAAMVRLMQLGRALRVPLWPQVTSRLIRHLYGADVHWDADLAPGLSIIHGIGLIIGHGAATEEGCILFQNVTLGEGIHPVTREVGAPRLGRDVHVGPGATLLGPIVIGAGSKIMAGCTVAESLPPRSLVRPAPVIVEGRAPAAAERPEGGGG